MLHTSIPLPPSVAALSIPERMAIVIREKAREGQPTTRDDFHQALETSDLSDGELDENIGRAKRLMHPEIVRHDQPAAPSYAWEQDLDYRNERVTRGAGIIAGMMPDPGDIHTQLRTAGFSTREVGALWGEIIARAGSMFQETRGARA